MSRVRTIHGGTEDVTQVVSVDPKDRTTGAYHEYEIHIIPQGGATPLGAMAKIFFQRRGVAEVGANGCSNEDLLAIVRDRLECFQNGKFPCSWNKEALRYVVLALACLHNHTADRKRRGVEGKHKRWAELASGGRSNS